MKSGLLDKARSGSGRFLTVQIFQEVGTDLYEFAKNTQETHSEWLAGKYSYQIELFGNDFVPINSESDQ